MTSSTKRNALILLGLVMIITVIIAAGLPQLELQPGMPRPSMDDGPVVMAPVEAEPIQPVSVNKFALVLFVILVTGSGLYVMYRLLRGAEWKSLPAFIWPALVISLIISSLVFLLLQLSNPESYMPMELPVPMPEPPVTTPLGTAPPLLLWLVGMGLLATGILIGVWLFTSSPRRATTIDIVGLEAVNARQKLKTGSDLKDVIIKCYRQMSLALAQEQGLEREDFMTTREFEDLLATAGVPHDPIHQLTQLFEAVRYGHWQPNPIDEEKAIHCLEAIMLYSRQAKEAN